MCFDVLIFCSIWASFLFFIFIHILEKPECVFLAMWFSSSIFRKLFIALDWLLAGRLIEILFALLHGWIDVNWLNSMFSMHCIYIYKMTFCSIHWMFHFISDFPPANVTSHFNSGPVWRRSLVDNVGLYWN